MNGRRIWLAVAMIAVMAAPAMAEDFWSSLKKDFKGLTGAIKGGIEDITEGKKDVEGVIDDAKQLQEEFAGSPENEPRYDPAWVAELQQRLNAEGFDPGLIDGAFGDRTSRAITTFQRQAGISPDGLPRPSVMRALRARTPTVQIAGPQPQPGGQAAPFSHGPAPGMETAGAALSQAAPIAQPAYPDFVRLALRADPAAFAAQREVAGVAYRLAVMDEPACRQFSERLAEMAGDAFLARDLALESAELLDEGLAALDASPPAPEVMLSDQLYARAYDFAAGLPALGRSADLGRRTEPDRPDLGSTLRRRAAAAPRAAEGSHDHLAGRSRHAFGRAGGCSRRVDPAHGRKRRA
jgi:Putative peptidoglycan binding domain